MGLTQPYIVGLGGRAQAGKSYISCELQDQLGIGVGLSGVVHMKFAAPLKDMTKGLIRRFLGVSDAKVLEDYIEGSRKDERFEGGQSLRMGAPSVIEEIAYAFQTVAVVLEDHPSTTRLRAKLASQDALLSTPRAIMQYLGTECGRDCFGPNFWVDTAFKAYEQYASQKSPEIAAPKYLIFDDMRFASERHGIRQYAASHGFKSALVAIARDDLGTLFDMRDGGHASENSYGHALDYNLCYAVASGDLDGLKDVASCIVDYISF